MPQAARILRLIALFVLITAIITAAGLLLFTERGQHITHHPHETGRQFHRWVIGHRAIAPICYVALFVALVILMLPVWWLQILAGYGFGLIGGALWTQLGAMLGAIAAVMIARWIAADWFHNKVETRLKKLAQLDDKLGHNGFLVVIAVRLMHFMPVGISNYVFGLTTITLADVVVGTLLGGLPVVLWWVAIGAGVRPWNSWRFLTLEGGIHVVLLVPIGLRYWKPQWFKKYGIE